MLTATFEWSVRINLTNNLREKIGAALRSLAYRIDGRLSLAIDIESTPPLSLEQKVECIQFANRQMKMAVADTVKTAAEERVLDVVMKEKHGTTT